MRHISLVRLRRAVSLFAVMSIMVGGRASAQAFDRVFEQIMELFVGPRPERREGQESGD